MCILLLLVIVVVVVVVVVVILVICPMLSNFSLCASSRTRPLISSRIENCCAQASRLLKCYLTHLEGPSKTRHSCARPVLLTNSGSRSVMSIKKGEGDDGDDEEDDDYQAS